MDREYLELARQGRDTKELRELTKNIPQWQVIFVYCAACGHVLTAAVNPNPPE
jgi:hypothetical protein